MPRRNLIALFLASLVALVCYQRASRNRYADTFAQAMNRVSTDYVDEVEPRILFEGAMDGMMNQLDMYSAYTPPTDYRRFKEEMDGEFPGIGIMVDTRPEAKPVTVLAPLPGSPAAKAGMKAGDLIIAVDGTETDGLTIEEAVALVKGPTGSSVKLRVERKDGSQPLEFTVPRAYIPIESVLGDARREDGTWIYRLVEHPRLGYIRIDAFAERTADDLKAALEVYQHPGSEIDGLIIDLRGNAGGLLSAAVDCCDQFLDEGLIVSTRGRHGIEYESHEATAGMAVDPNLPIAVLVDRRSASASEIMAAALQDHKRAVVVGERSWGKGTVQNVIELEGGRSALRLTIASYWRPSGKDMHKRRTSKNTDDWGVRPDAGLEASLTNEQYETFVLGRRERDLTPLAKLEEQGRQKQKTGDKEQSTSTPLSETDNERPAGDSAPPAPTASPSEDEPHEPIWIDLQLEKAIEYLQKKAGDPDAGKERA